MKAGFYLKSAFLLIPTHILILLKSIYYYFIYT